VRARLLLNPFVSAASQILNAGFTPIQPLVWIGRISTKFDLVQI
jgi:hypothetical protein